MKRRVNIGIGLLHTPQLVYMDEPTVGVDPQSRRRILDTVHAPARCELKHDRAVHHAPDGRGPGDRATASASSTTAQIIAAGHGGRAGAAKDRRTGPAGVQGWASSQVPSLRTC
jgi:hypothetical protein